MQIIKWNWKRGNINFDSELELRMLSEEAQEFKDGLEMYFRAQNKEDALEALVELVDAWCDYQFVLQGTIYKYLGSTAPFNFESVKTQEKYMYSILTRDFNISDQLLDNCLSAVVIANNAKGTEKVNGKIQKGADWVDPKTTIKGLLDGI